MTRLPTPILITGGQGILGSEFGDYFSRTYSDTISSSRRDFDFTDETQVDHFLSKHRPKILIHCGAYTKVDDAESNREVAYRANAFGTALLARKCREIGCRIVYFSTDQVFDGALRRAREESEDTRPANYYAHTKWLGERSALEVPGTLVVRVQWLYGKKKDRFTPLRELRTFHPFSDQFGAPTWAGDVTQVVEKLLLKEATGIFHLTYDDHASWAEVYTFAKEKLQLSTQLVPVTTAERALPASRPLFSVLSNRKLCHFLGIAGLGSWKTSLETFLCQL